MKKFLLLPLLLTVVTFTSTVALQAQMCMHDSTIQTVGIFPSDTLPDFSVNLAANEKVDFIFPPDTTVLGQTVPFDSFLVTSVSNLPPGIQWECNVNHPVCNYLVTPGELTRGCVAVFGTPTQQNPAYPLWDSATVTGQGWVTVPIIGPQSVNDDIIVYYRIGPPVNLDASLSEQVDLQVKPNPVVDNSVVAYNVPFTTDVNVTLYNQNGQEVRTIHAGEQNAGRHVLPVMLNGTLSPGVYFVRFEMNDGEFQTTRKLVSLN
ncbi:MAG: T9SS type A sorting domain-containing protein [Bacteroidota bacterium]